MLNVNDICVSVSYYPMIAPDSYHPPLRLDFFFDLQPSFTTRRRIHCQRSICSCTVLYLMFMGHVPSTTIVISEIYNFIPCV
jgi:hypothetical protein